ncbi:MAG: response regulator [Verrucomicrobiota bacterium]|nr:response regulator [Verrucomicrobiota bacterium]
MKRKILTVDDSKTIRMIVAKAFKPFDCEVLEASNGVEGLAIAGMEKPDLLILDLTMPIMDGVEMLGRFKTNPELKTIPVIMLTAEAGRENVIKIAKMGVRDYLVKPFKEEVLAERVCRIIDLKKIENGPKTKRFDDPLQILVVDDKPAIHEQIRLGLSETRWTVTGCVSSEEAAVFPGALPDIILVSLSLPENAALTFFHSVKANPRTKNIPVFGLCVKTAVDDQSRAQQSGFAGVITKPIDYEDLKGKISRVLSLDTSYRYFDSHDNILVIKLPPVLTPLIANEVSLHLRTKISEAVDSGFEKVIMDMSQTLKADITLIKIGIEVSQLCQELSLKYRMVGSNGIYNECKNYEETKDWRFEKSFEEAISALSPQTVAEAV